MGFYRGTINCFVSVLFVYQISDLFCFQLTENYLNINNNYKINNNKQGKFTSDITMKVCIIIFKQIKENNMKWYTYSIQPFYFVI